MADIEGRNPELNQKGIHLLTEPYSSFFQINRSEREGHSYQIISIQRSSGLVILAPHGGGIEPGTSELAKAIAGDSFSLYCFEGLIAEGSYRLHIPSTNFDEPLCLKLLETAAMTAALHGCEDRAPAVYVGGLHTQLVDLVDTTLKQAGFPSQVDRTGHHSGRDPRNICNRNTIGKGLQLEISHGLRRQFFAGLTRSQRSQTTPAFAHFVEALRGVFLDACRKGLW
jgi:phage replication-related protein YjqB (UPF0714/DUF867 family)